MEIKSKYEDKIKTMKYENNESIKKIESEYKYKETIKNKELAYNKETKKKNLNMRK